MHHLWPCGPSGKRVQKTLGTPFESQQNASRLIVDWIQFDNNRRLRTVRREIARIYTVMRERELGLASGPDGDDA